MSKKSTDPDYLRLYAFAAAWVKNQMRPFTSEDLKQAFYDDGNEPLHNPNHFGGVVNALAREKAINKNGVATAKGIKAHGRLLNAWISVEYSRAQAAKRQIPKDEQIELFT